MEDLPNEIILKILELVNIKDLFRCMAVNKRFREIAHDQSLWNIMHLTGEGIADVLTAELLQQILAKGCQYLSLYLCCIEKNNLRRFEKKLQFEILVYFAMS